jgi:hypothetical protein
LFDSVDFEFQAPFHILDKKASLQFLFLDNRAETDVAQVKAWKGDGDEEYKKDATMNRNAWFAA